MKNRTTHHGLSQKNPHKVVDYLKYWKMYKLYLKFHLNYIILHEDDPIMYYQISLNYTLPHTNLMKEFLVIEKNKKNYFYKD
jgi:hypothetical protein